MKHLGSTISRQIKNQTKTRQNSDDTQIFRPDLRFASRKNSKTTQKKGPNPQPKTPKKPQNFPWTRRKNPTCHEKCTKKQISLSTAQKRVKSCATMKSSNKLAKFHCQAVHYGSHLRILSDVLFQSSRRLIIFESSCSRQKRLSLHSAEGYRNLQTSHSSVVRPMWFSELLAAVPSQEGTGLRAQTNQLPVQDGHAVFPRLAHQLQSSTTTGEAPFCAPVFCYVVRTKRVPSLSYLYVVCDKKGSLLLDCDLGKVPD